MVGARCWKHRLMSQRDLDQAAMRLLLRDQREALDLTSDDYFGCYPELKERYAAVMAERPGSPEAMVAARAIAYIDHTLFGAPLPALGPAPIEKSNGGA